MAGRKSSRAVIAQKKAAEAALKFQQQQERLLVLAAEFFSIPEKTGAADLEKQIEALEEKIQQLRQKITEKEEASQREQTIVVAQMKTEGITVSEIAQRLAISIPETRKLIKMASQLKDNEADTSVVHS